MVTIQGDSRYLAAAAGAAVSGFRALTGGAVAADKGVY
jgi:hypothetical protein